MTVLLGVHGVAHLAGFAVAFKLLISDEVPYRTQVLGGTVEVGDTGIRVVGVAWLLMAIAFAIAATGVGTRASWALPCSQMIVAASTAMCVIGWPDSRWGLLANVLIVSLLFVAAGTGKL
jgi:hypothetical protein